VRDDSRALAEVAGAAADCRGTLEDLLRSHVWLWLSVPGAITPGPAGRGGASGSVAADLSRQAQERSHRRPQAGQAAVSGEVPAAYVPSQDASAGVNRLGHITRQGPATARQYLVDAAWRGVYRSPTIRAYCERVQHGRPERRKIALVATAHYLLWGMHAMLVRNEPWHEAA